MSQMASDTVCQYPHNGHLMRIKGSFYRQKLSIFIQNPEIFTPSKPFFFIPTKSTYISVCQFTKEK